MKTLLEKFKDGEIVIEVNGMGEELERVLLEVGIKPYTDNTKLWGGIKKDTIESYSGTHIEDISTPTVSAREFIDSLKIKPEGYEYKGWKLGQRVVRYGKDEYIIVAFDERDFEDVCFIGINHSDGKSPQYATSKLKTCDNICWVHEGSLTSPTRKLEVEFTQIENVVCAKVTHMDESLRGYLDISNDKYQLISVGMPEINNSNLCVRGNIKEGDNRVTSYTFRSIEVANEWLVNIKELIVKVNIIEDDKEEYICISNRVIFSKAGNIISIIYGEIYSFTESEYEKHKGEFADIKNAPRDTPIWVREGESHDWEKAWLSDCVDGCFSVYVDDEYAPCKREDAEDTLHYPQAKFRKVLWQGE